MKFIKKAQEFAYNDEVIYYQDFFIYETIYYDKNTILQLRPLAKNILSLSNYYTNTEDLKNKKITIEEFIRQKYWDKFKFDYFLSGESASFYYTLFVGIIFQLGLWGII